jgi:uncharacterized protein
MIFEVTPLYVGIFLIFGWYLSFRIIKLRRSLGVGLGSGKNPELARAIRVHGNFIEHVPLTLIGLALLETQGLHFGIVHVLGLMLFTARILHARGLTTSEGKSMGRFHGTLLTFIVQFILAMALILNFVHLVILEAKA